MCRQQNTSKEGYPPEDMVEPEVKMGVPEHAITRESEKG
jgi:hypothetical protein